MLVDGGLDDGRCCDDVRIDDAGIDVGREEQPVVFGGLRCGSGVLETVCDVVNDSIHFGCWRLENTFE